MNKKEDIAIDKALEELDSEEDELEELESWNPVLLSRSKKVSELTVDELRDILREEINRNLHIYQVPNYQGVKIPRTPGELNQGNVEYRVSNHTDFDPTRFSEWNYGYKEK